MAATSSEVLAMIQTSARNGTLLQSCAPEVKELMVQIDGLISSKQREWESSMRGLQTQLQHRERDIASMKVKLQERNSQVDQLRLQSTALQREYKARNTDYEAQLTTLRSEVSRLSQAYNHLRAKRSRGKDPHRETQVSRLSQDLASLSVELSRCCDENKELRVQVQQKDQWMVAMETENGTLKENVGLLQETILSKDELIRTLEDQLSFAHSSAHFSSCQADLCQAQNKLKSQLTLEKALRQELKRLEESKEPCSSEHSKKLNVRLLENGRERPDNETQSIEEKECSGLVQQFVERVDMLGSGGDGLVVLEPTEIQGSTGHFDNALKHILETHFNQLDHSLKNLLTTP